jgi:hypothetical protein
LWAIGGEFFGNFLAFFSGNCFSKNGNLRQDIFLWNYFSQNGKNSPKKKSLLPTP